MITINEEKWMGRTGPAGQSVYLREGVCLSTDTKPTDWGNGSRLLEMDTSRLYMYDAESHEWREW